MNKQGSIIGLNLGIDDNYLAEVVKQTVIAGISESLNGKNEIVSQLVHDVLNLKVDKTGKVSSWERDNNITLLEYHVRRAINDVAKEEIAQAIEKSKPKIRKAIKNELCKEGAMDNIAAAFVSKLTSEITNGWRTNIEINFEVLDD